MLALTKENSLHTQHKYVPYIHFIVIKKEIYMRTMTCVAVHE